jgi:hypothetical protein
MTIDKELEKCGAKITAERFNEILLELLKAMYPGHSIDALLCDPHFALRYCEYIRMESRAVTLPSETILRRLANLRKRGDAPKTSAVKKALPRANQVAIAGELPLYR